MSSYNIATEIQLQTLIGDLRAEFKQNGFLSVSVKAGKKRSLSQNDISHAWYEQLARELREDDALGWKCYAKLTIGVPILRAEDEEFRAVYDSAIKGLSYEQKLGVMKILPVTSLMTKAQLSKYLEGMQTEFQKRGVWLQFPEAA